MTKRMTYQEKQARKALASGTPDDTILTAAILVYCHVDLLLSGNLNPKSCKSGETSMQIWLGFIMSSILLKRMARKAVGSECVERIDAVIHDAQSAFKKSFDRSIAKRYKSIRVESEKRKKLIQEWAHCYVDLIRRSTVRDLYESSKIAEASFRINYLEIA